jgi:hypothetical protein
MTPAVDQAQEILGSEALGGRQLHPHVPQHPSALFVLIEVHGRQLVDLCRRASVFEVASGLIGLVARAAIEVGLADPEEEMGIGPLVRVVEDRLERPVLKADRYRLLPGIEHEDDPPPAHHYHEPHEIARLVGRARERG